jgi:hypothetical protein
MMKHERTNANGSARVCMRLFFCRTAAPAESNAEIVASRNHGMAGRALRT